MFYFSSMMAVDGEALATDSSLSAHPASVAACMARPPAWESRPQKREMRYEAWGELLNRAPAWGGNWLRRARGGRWISEVHSSYPVGYPAGLDAE